MASRLKPVEGFEYFAEHRKSPSTPSAAREPNDPGWMLDTVDTLDALGLWPGRGRQSVDSVQSVRGPRRLVWSRTGPLRLHHLMRQAQGGVPIAREPKVRL